MSRFRQYGATDLLDRPSRHRSHPAATTSATVSRLLHLRRAERPGRDELARRTGRRYEREQPGDLIHIDVKKLGRIPDGGGWRLDCLPALDHRGAGRQRRMGFDYIRVAIDDQSRLAFARTLPDEKGPTCAAFLAEAASLFADHGGREVMTDNAWNYRHSRDFQTMLAALGPRHTS